MRPERNALRVLSTTRSKAKMYEFAVPEEAHIELSVSPDILFSLAVGLVGDAAGAIAAEAREDDPRTTTSEALNFAATFFDSYIDAKLNEDVREEFALLAAASYFLADMPGNARVLASRIQAPAYPGARSLDWLTHRLLLSDYEGDPGYRELNRLTQGLQGYLVGSVDTDQVLGICRQIRSEAYDSGEGRAVLYADIAIAIVRKKIENASRAQLPPASELPLDNWLDSLRKPGFVLELWPAQKKICAAGLLAGKPGIIQMPTSAGKTRATELIIRSAFLSDRTLLAVIVAPFRALCHDIRGDLARVFQGENIAINEATDSYQLDLSIEELWERKTVLIVTPEKLLYILRRNPDLCDQVGLIIYDEGHLFDSPSRGTAYELLLTTVKLLLPEGSQTILISAVIANASAVADWLFGYATAVVDGQGLSPTARSVAFANWTTQLGRLQYVSPTDPEDIEFYVPRVIDRVQLGRRPREKIRYFPEQEKGTSIGLYLGLKAVRNGSIALFCGRKDTAAGICDLVVDIHSRGFDCSAPLAQADAGEVAKIAALFGRQVGDLNGATRAARLGMFPHHANVPHGLRLAIEHAMKEGMIRFVICTSTLAQGVNLPIKYLIVTSVYQGIDRIKVRDFHNLIGRAGRAGMHTEGSVIFSQNEVFDGRLDRTKRWRWNAAKELLNAANSEPCVSSILLLFEPFIYGNPPQSFSLTPESLHRLALFDRAAMDQAVTNALRTRPAAKASDFRHFLEVRAHILHSISTFILAHLDFDAENLAEDAELLCSYTLAYHLADTEKRVSLQTVFRNLALYLVENAPAPELRLSMRRSPLSPASVRALSEWVAANLEMLREADAESTLLDALSDQILMHSTSEAILALSDRSAAIAS